jgi:fatty-acyl-CoA synthase
VSNDIQDESHTIGRWLIERAAHTPHRIAIDDRGVTIDYADLARRSRALAEGLLDAGFGAGSRIATVAGNSIDQVVLFFACALTGAAFIPLSWRQTTRELVDTLGRSGPHLVVVDDEFAVAAGEALRELEAAPPVAALGTAGIERSLPLAQQPRDRRPVRDDDPLLIVYTSGSEAAPKGVILTHANCFWNNLALGRALPLGETDVVLAVLPQFHVAAWNCQPLLAWWGGATVVLERSFDTERVLQLIRERRVTAMMGVPTQYAMLAESRGWATSDLSSVRLALVGGATLPGAVREAWQARGIELVQGYGLTEAGPNVLHCPNGVAADRRGAVGRPYPHVSVQVVDPETLLPLRGDATGELWVRGPSVFAGYLGDPAATARAMHGDWLRTGDVVHRDGDGVFTVVDRLKDIFISGGENVAPAEVEHALCLHPLITGAAVVGVPDPVWGERGVAFVTVRSGAVLSQDEVFAHARRTLAAFKVPIAIRVVDSLPRSSIDKLARSRLREHARTIAASAQEVSRERSR